MTYVLVVFSILVQGPTIGELTRSWLPDGAEPDDPWPSIDDG
jgi:hypothetical protein